MGIIAGNLINQILDTDCLQSLDQRSIAALSHGDRIYLVPASPRLVVVTTLSAVPDTVSFELEATAKVHSVVLGHVPAPKVSSTQADDQSAAVLKPKMILGIQFMTSGLMPEACAIA
jgi:hypothetical protein